MQYHFNGQRMSKTTYHNGMKESVISWHKNGKKDLKRITGKERKRGFGVDGIDGKMYYIQNYKDGIQDEFRLLVQNVRREKQLQRR